MHDSGGGGVADDGAGQGGGIIRNKADGNMESFIIFLVMFVTIIGPSAVIAAIGYASIRALGRNPSAAPKILQAMIVALVFSEAIAVIALLILFQIFGRG